MNWEQRLREFWNKRSIFNYLLLPVSLLYYLLHLLNFHLLQSPKKVTPLVICVGNITVGGSGKTPFALSLAHKIIKMGLKPAFITRGYGSLASKRKVATLVKLPKHSALEVGDEAILLARVAPTYVGGNRYMAALKAERDGFDIIIMDDGLQNNTLQKDYSFLVLDDGYGLGNGYTLPAGPLRELYKNAKVRVDTTVLITQSDKPSKIKKHDITANIVPLKKPKSRQRYFAFCGIGRPDKFFNTLAQAGFDVVDIKVFNDHYAYTLRDIKELIKLADGLKLITTEKDFVKIPAAYVHQIEVLPIELQFDIPDKLLIMLNEKYFV